MTSTDTWTPLSQIYDRGMVSFKELVPGSIICCENGMDCCAWKVVTLEPKHNWAYLKSMNPGRNNFRILHAWQWHGDHIYARTLTAFENTWSAMYIPDTLETYETWVTQQVSLHLGSEELF